MVRPPLRLLRLANPLVRAVLASPAHRLLSGSLLLLVYRGRRSDRMFRIPLLYARDGERLLALATRPEQKRWWRSFRDGAPATVVLARRSLDVEGRLLDGEEARRAADRYVERFRRTAPFVADAGAAIVAFTPREPPTTVEP